jgi:CheY-like chemotaxis protein
MCITKPVKSLHIPVSDIISGMHTFPKAMSEPITRTHKEYGDSFTTICTQCKRILFPSLVRSISASISSSEEDNHECEVDPVEHTSHPCLSHGLCRSCFDNMDADLSSSITPTTPTGSRRFLSKSLSSPGILRHIFSHARSTPARVLIVDDNRLLRQIHKRMVEQAGYECDVAFSGVQALEMVEKHNYALILMDLVMTPLDGLTTTRKIRSSLIQYHHVASQLPKIVAVTGLSVDEKLVGECTSAGMDEVLQKPISPTLLNSVLQKHTSSRQKIDR